MWLIRMDCMSNSIADVVFIISVVEVAVVEIHWMRTQKLDILVSVQRQGWSPVNTDTDFWLVVENKGRQGGFQNNTPTKLKLVSVTDKGLTFFISLK